MIHTRMLRCEDSMFWPSHKTLNLNPPDAVISLSVTSRAVLAQACPRFQVVSVPCTPPSSSAFHVCQHGVPVDLQPSSLISRGKVKLKIEGGVGIANRAEDWFERRWRRDGLRLYKNARGKVSGQHLHRFS
ncbi:hypothetical protein IF2G_05690 [Cordyceps javanica]|nr:hypothetical protein IF2G_05690 [Cordyceps javanica]